MAYVGGSTPTTGCIFCNALTADDDPRHLVLVRRPAAFLILNAYPYTPGHLMAALNRHVGTVGEATAEELAQAMQLVAVATSALVTEYRAEGFNIGLNQGRVAGAGIVYDSDPASEQQECINKAKALFRAAEEAVRFASLARFGQ